MRDEARAAWWRGRRGEWLVAVQVALMALVFVGPRNLRGWPAWPELPGQIGSVVGMGLMAGGLAFLVAGGLRLGSNLTPVPCPKPGGCLIQDGVYGLVRHPMYSGGIGLALGWGLVVHGWLTLGYAAVLVAFLSYKSRREERWLAATYPDYADYQRRVPRLAPRLAWPTH